MSNSLFLRSPRLTTWPWVPTVLLSYYQPSNPGFALDLLWVQGHSRLSSLPLASQEGNEGWLTMQSFRSLGWVVLHQCTAKALARADYQRALSITSAVLLLPKWTVLLYIPPYPMIGHFLIFSDLLTISFLPIFTFPKIFWLGSILWDFFSFFLCSFI